MFLSEDKKRVILIDFGSAEDLDNPQLRKMKIDNDPRRMSHLNFVGTSQYMAPECVRNKGTPTLAHDSWSLGCILYQLETGLLPFRGGSDYLIFRRSTESRFKVDYPPELLTEKAKNLITKCLQVDPTKRPTIEEILADPYFDGVDDIQEPPQLRDWEQIMRDFIADLITRANVHTYDGQEKFEEHFQKTIRDRLKGLVDDAVIDHYKGLALLFLFSIDPE